MDVLRIKLILIVSFFFCFAYLVSLTYSFLERSYIKRQTLSGGGHTFSGCTCYNKTVFVSFMRYLYQRFGISNKSRIK